MSRDLADRDEEAAPPATAGAMQSLVPLPEILSEIHQVGAKSKRVAQHYESLLGRLGPELPLLNALPLEDIAPASSSLVAEAVSRLRRQEVIRQAGYDGVYGTIRLFQDAELRQYTLGESLFQEEREAPPAGGDEAGAASANAREPARPRRIEASSAAPDGRPAASPGQADGEHPASPGQADGEHPASPGQADGGRPASPGQADGGRPASPGQVDGEHPAPPGQADGAHPASPGQVDGEHPAPPGQADGAHPASPGQADGRRVGPDAAAMPSASSARNRHRFVARIRLAPHRAVTSPTYSPGSMPISGSPSRPSPVRCSSWPVRGPARREP